MPFPPKTGTSLIHLRPPPIVERLVRLFLFERFSEAIRVGITMQAKRLRPVDDSVPIVEDKYRWSCEFRDEGANGFFHVGSKAERSSFF